MTRIKTARLHLVPLEQHHIPPLVDLWCDPDVTRYMGGPRDRTTLPAALEEDLGSPAQFDLWPVPLQASGAVVGHAGIIPKEIAGKDEHELIYVFAKAHWGRGYATEIAEALIGYAAVNLNVARLAALIDPENNASAHVAKKTGFVLERTGDREGGHAKHLYVRSLANPEAAAR